MLIRENLLQNYELTQTTAGNIRTLFRNCSRPKEFTLKNNDHRNIDGEVILDWKKQTVENKQPVNTYRNNGDLHSDSYIENYETEDGSSQPEFEETSYINEPVPGGDDFEDPKKLVDELRKLYNSNISSKNTIKVICIFKKLEKLGIIEF